MAIIKAKARQDSAVGRVSEGSDVYLRAFRDGSLVTTDWKQALIMEGRGFTFNVGALTAPVKGGGAGQLAIDDDAPDFGVGIPTGTSILPIYVDVALLMTAGTADSDEIDILLAVDQDTYHPVGNSTAETIYNLNTLYSRASNCWARSEWATTFTTTDPVYDLELAHVSKVFEMYSTVGVLWDECRMVYEPLNPPIINGPATLFGFFGGTKVQYGFACVQWLELPTSSISG